MNDVLFQNAQLVLEDEVAHGSLRVSDGKIVEIDLHTEHRHASAGSIDCEGDFLIPGLIEIHTDALEWHLRPRPQSLWPADAAVAGHDAVLASSGITTVLDSLCVGDLGGDGFRADILISALEAITCAQNHGYFRIDHKLHYRCEVADPRTPGLFEDLLENPLLTLVSLMDHTPGARQYTDLTTYRKSGSSRGETEAVMEARIARLQERQAQYATPNWTRIAKHAKERNLPLASHDDATIEDVQWAIASGVTISEFPTTELAAKAAKAAGMATAAGAPNIVRGGSHSGNVSAAALAESDLLDIITSDYVPYSLLHAPFALANRGKVSLAAAISLVTSRPADCIGLTDRGRLAEGKRADLVRVRLDGGVPRVRGVLSNGQRVA